MALAKNQEEIRCWNQEVGSVNREQVSRLHLLSMAHRRGRGRGRWWGRQVLGEVDFDETRRELKFNEIQGRRDPTGTNGQTFP